MNIMTVVKMMKTQNRARKEFHKQRWKRSGLVCVKCGCTQIHKHGKLKNGLLKYRCYGCKRVFSDISDTPFCNMKLKAELVLYGAFEYMHDPRSLSFSRKAGINKNTGWRLFDLFRRHLPSPYIQEKLKGVIEIDETKLNGEWLLGMLERAGKVIILPILNRQEGTLLPKIETHVEKKSSVVTDQLSSYLKLFHLGYDHWALNHSEREWVWPGFPRVNTQHIENLWRHLKRRVNHFCHGVSDQHRWAYINEFLFFKNHPQIQNTGFSPLLSAILNFVPPLSKK